MTTLLTNETGALATGEAVMNKTQLDGLLTGNTVYLDVPPGGPGGAAGGVAICYYGADRRAVFKLPTGTTLAGSWALNEDHYRADWDNGPKNSCSKLIKANGSIVIVDVATGDKRGAVTKIVPGNPENLPEIAP